MTGVCCLGKLVRLPAVSVQGQAKGAGKELEGNAKGAKQVQYCCLSNCRTSSQSFAVCPVLTFNLLLQDAKRALD